MDEALQTPRNFSPLMIGVVALAIILCGGLLGYFLAPKKSWVAGVSTTPPMVKSATEVGSTDTSTFRDTARGKLEKGGLGTEGTHKLIREGGPSQTVYLTSSVIDLDEFVGKDVEVWGESIKAAKAPWLMDVGRVKLSP